MRKRRFMHRTRQLVRIANQSRALQPWLKKVNQAFQLIIFVFIQNFLFIKYDVFLKKQWHSLNHARMRTT